MIGGLVIGVVREKVCRLLCQCHTSMDALATSHPPFLPLPPAVPSPLFLFLVLFLTRSHCYSFLVFSILIYLSYFHGINFTPFSLYLG